MILQGRGGGGRPDTEVKSEEGDFFFCDDQDTAVA